MRNLEQIRAAAALKVAGKTTKAEASKLPAMILGNGLLAAISFATEMKEKEPKRRGMKVVMDAAACHLSALQILKATDAQSLLEELSNAESATLQRATTEVLAFAAYVKRFATRESE